MSKIQNKILKYKTVLALDCCFETASLAIYDARNEKNSISFLIQEKNQNNQHSDIVFELLEQSLHKNNISLSEFDALSVTIGPGRFNGIRVGIALMKALALASKKPLFGFSTLLINAKQTEQDLNKKIFPNCPIAILQKARQESVVIQIYNQNLKPYKKPATILKKDVEEYLKTELGKSKFLCLGGEISEQFYQQLSKNNILEIDKLLLHKQNDRNNAKTLAIITAKQEFEPQKPNPLYLRQPHITKPKQKLTAAQ